MLYIFARISDKTIVETRKFDSAPTAGFLDAIASNHANNDVTNIAYYGVPEADAKRIDKGDEYTLTWSGNHITALDFSVEDSKRWLRVEASQSGVKADAPGSLTLSSVTEWIEGTYKQGVLVWRNSAVYQCAVSSTSSTPTAASPDWDRLCSAAKLTLSVLDSNKKMDLTYNENVIINIIPNTGQQIPMRCNFVDGVCVKIIGMKTNQDCGKWFFPNSDVRTTIVDAVLNTKENMGVDAQVEFSVILPF